MGHSIVLALTSNFYFIVQFSWQLAQNRKRIKKFNVAQKEG